jgi:hypothetical protein
VGRVFADYSEHMGMPDSLVKADIAGVWRYVGTPSHPKNLSPVEYSALRSRGLLVFGIYELTETDWRGGQTAGEQNANAARADFRRCGAGPDDWCGVAVDAHVVTPQDLATARAYVKGAHLVLGPSTACYGPVELIHASYVDRTSAVRWQWGHAPVAGNPDHVHYWQRNQPGLHGPNQQVIGGVLCDLSDELIRPVGSAPTLKPPSNPVPKGSMMSTIVTGEFAPGQAAPHKLVVPVGTASHGISRAWFSLAMGFERTASGTLWAIGRAPGGTADYLINARSFTLVMDVRQTWELPPGTDQVSVQLTSDAPVGWAVETVPVG